MTWLRPRTAARLEAKQHALQLAKWKRLLAEDERFRALYDGEGDAQHWAQLLVMVGDNARLVGVGGGSCGTP